MCVFLLNYVLLLQEIFGKLNPISTCVYMCAIWGALHAGSEFEIMLIYLYKDLNVSWRVWSLKILFSLFRIDLVTLLKLLYILQFTSQSWGQPGMFSRCRESPQDFVVSVRVSICLSVYLCIYLMFLNFFFMLETGISLERQMVVGKLCDLRVLITPKEFKCSVLPVCTGNSSDPSSRHRYTQIFPT